MANHEGYAMSFGRNKGYHKTLQCTNRGEIAMTCPVKVIIRDDPVDREPVTTKIQNDPSKVTVTQWFTWFEFNF